MVELSQSAHATCAGRGRAAALGPARGRDGSIAVNTPRYAAKFMLRSGSDSSGATHMRLPASPAPSQ